jgi:alkanesulfonate monooxygenase SsuD/methylene tetrahydromethanopterin reductase-like flavin-dependent oxidoreductase (luciferase family)
VKFGVFYEHQIPRPWDAESEHRQFKNALEQVELADKLGYDFAWCTEHHFMEEYSHASAPEVFLAAASQRTKNIRLGHGIIQLTTNHPARVAERVSTLDLVSDGRVELGLGEGGSTTELHPFDRKFRDKRAIWDEALQVLIPMLKDSPDGIEWHGEFFDFPLRAVLPKPLQKPHPPLWVACSQYETIERAGELGLGALGFQFLSSEAATAWVNAYYRAYTTKLKPLADYKTNPNIAMVSALMCADTDEEAQRRADGWSFFQFALIYYNKSGPVAPGTVNLWEEYLVWRESPKGQVYAPGLIGTPETIVEQLDAFDRAHVDQVILLNQAGKNTHEDICESLELFAKEVMPEFHDREPQHQEWKRQVLAGEIELEDIDTSQFKPATTQTPKYGNAFTDYRRGSQ